MTYQLSSGLTLLLRLFIPIVWLVFFGSFMVAGWVSEEDFMGPFPISGYRWVTTLFVAAGALGFRLTFWRLHRVDGEEQGIFVSDYFRTVRYTRDSVQAVELRHYGLFHLACIRLHRAGRFGKTIWFWPSRRRFTQFARQWEGWPIRLPGGQ